MSLLYPLDELLTFLLHLFEEWLVSLLYLLTFLLYPFEELLCGLFSGSGSLSWVIMGVDCWSVWALK